MRTLWPASWACEPLPPRPPRIRGTLCGPSAPHRAGAAADPRRSQDEDLELMGMKKIERNRFRKALDYL